ncbi:MAG: type II toxin-antitoxin system HicB family antitoxin [Gaiellaceae bacterium]
MTTFTHERGLNGAGTSKWTRTGNAPKNGRSEAVTQKELPAKLLQRYASAAVRAAELSQRDDGSWFAEVPGLEGVWAEGASHREALDELEEVVFEWTILKIREEDRDLPVIEDINLNDL